MTPFGSRWPQILFFILLQRLQVSFLVVPPAFTQTALTLGSSGKTRHLVACLEAGVCSYKHPVRQDLHFRTTFLSPSPIKQGNEVMSHYTQKRKLTYRRQSIQTDEQTSYAFTTTTPKQYKRKKKRCKKINVNILS